MSILHSTAQHCCLFWYRDRTVHYYLRSCNYIILFTRVFYWVMEWRLGMLDTEQGGRNLWQVGQRSPRQSGGWGPQKKFLFKMWKWAIFCYIGIVMIWWYHGQHVTGNSLVRNACLCLTNAVTEFIQTIAKPGKWELVLEIGPKE